MAGRQDLRTLKGARVIPTINVNIRATHAHPNTGDASFCDVDCRPVLIPLPLEPFRSVTVSVALGECPSWCRLAVNRNEPGGQHSVSCPARPVRVSCSISGKTWEESEVMTDTDARPAMTHEQRFLAAHACHARWALVKALVLNHPVPANSHAELALWEQRDAVYAALADMARAEQVHFNASTTLFSALKACDIEHEHVTGPASYAMGWHDPSDDAAAVNSRAGLAAYVEMLIEQVGTLP
jgi:hypothetical protein